LAKMRFLVIMKIVCFCHFRRQKQRESKNANATKTPS